MTPSERLKEEEAAITARLGYYIPPYRMANLTKAASKITEILTKADTIICYQECKIILKIVEASIAAITEED